MDSGRTLLDQIMRTAAAAFSSLDDDWDDARYEAEVSKQVRSIAARFRDEVRRVGLVELLVAMFDNKANSVTPYQNGASVLAPFWVEFLDYPTLCELVARTEAVPYGWYELMWFCHKWLRVDYLELLARLGLVDHRVLSSRTQQRPTTLTIVQMPLDESREYLTIAATGRNPNVFWRRLAEQVHRPA